MRTAQPKWRNVTKTQPEALANWPRALCGQGSYKTAHGSKTTHGLVAFQGLPGTTHTGEGSGGAAGNKQTGRREATKGQRQPQDQHPKKREAKKKQNNGCEGGRKAKQQQQRTKTEHERTQRNGAPTYSVLSVGCHPHLFRPLRVCLRYAYQLIGSIGRGGLTASRL